MLVSELMAQQTQAARAAEAWTAWMARWPTVASLAAAPVADVLRAWQGLGYNRRALNLHRAAQAIVREHGGVVPSTVEELERAAGRRAVHGAGGGGDRLPGAGRCGGHERAARAGADRGRRPGGVPGRQIQALADATVPPDRPDAWTHALMDLGARLCRPARPRCADCPAIAWCRYAAGERPRPRPRAAVPARRPEPAFPTTNRWLRGRILDRARAADDGGLDPVRAVQSGSHCAGARSARRSSRSAAKGCSRPVRRDGGIEARLPR